MKKILTITLLFLLIVGLFVACNAESVGNIFEGGTVTVTFDFATYAGDIDAESYLFFDAGLTKPIIGSSYTAELKYGTTIGQLCIYDAYEVYAPGGDGVTVYLYPMEGSYFSFVDVDGNDFASDKPITSDMTLFLKEGVGCVAEGCVITMADGSTKNVEDIKLGEELLTWDFYTGSLVGKKVISIDKTPTTTRPEIIITTDAGTVINIVDVQAFFDTELKQYFNISNVNYNKQIGRNIMVCHDGSTVTSEKIVSIVLEEKAMELYDLITEDSLNFFSDNALTVVPLLFSITPYEVDGSYKYDSEKMAQDRAKYGLTRYENFEQYCSREAFEKLRLGEVQILLGKKLISQDYLKYVINKFLVSTIGIR